MAGPGRFAIIAIQGGHRRQGSSKMHTVTALPGNWQGKTGRGFSREIANTIFCFGHGQKSSFHLLERGEYSVKIC
jgi:hypothetical protein